MNSGFLGFVPQRRTRCTRTSIFVRQPRRSGTRDGHNFPRIILDERKLSITVSLKRFLRLKRIFRSAFISSRLFLIRDVSIRISISSILELALIYKLFEKYPPSSNRREYLPSKYTRREFSGRFLFISRSLSCCINSHRSNFLLTAR